MNRTFAKFSFQRKVLQQHRRWNLLLPQPGSTTTVVAIHWLNPAIVRSPVLQYRFVITAGGKRRGQALHDSRTVLDSSRA